MSHDDKELAGLKLVDRLIDLLGDSVSETPPRRGNNDRVGNLDDPAPPKGISLPATAIDWLAGNKDDTTDKWTLLVALLHHVKSLRVTLEPWPLTNQTSVRRKSKTPVDEATVATRLFLANLRHQPIVDLQLFPKLQILWLDRIPIEWIQGISALRDCLTCLRITSSAIYNLRILLYDTQGPLFPKLTHLKLSSCSLHDKSGMKSQSKFDQHLPTIATMSESLRSLDLSCNDFCTESAAMAGVRFLRTLQKLDLSHNRLTNLTNIHQRLHTIRILNLSYNRLYTISGIDQLSTLVTLRLAHNRLADLEDATNRLAGLRELQHLSLEGNPLQMDDTGSSVSDTYRLDVLNSFRERRFASLGASDFANLNLRSVQKLLPTLDGKAASLKELKALRNRTFLPIRLIPAAVQLSARQSARVITAVAGDMTIAGFQKRHHTVPSDRSKPPFSSVDVVRYLARAGLHDERSIGSTMRDDQNNIGSVVPKNVLVETCSNAELQEWESAFHDNLGMRYVAGAHPQAIASEGGSRQGETMCEGEQLDEISEEQSLPTDLADKNTGSSVKGETEIEDLGALSLSAIQPDEDDMKASGTTTVTTAESTQLMSRRSEHNGVGVMKDNSGSSVTPQGAQMQLHVTPVSNHHWQDDNMSLPSSLGTPYKNDDGLTKWEILRLAEENSKFEGSYVYQKLLVHNHLELYFEQFVFAEPRNVSSDLWYETLCHYPKIGVWPIDRKRRDEASNSQQFTLNSDEREILRRVWKETIVPCGKVALRRLTPKRSDRYGFHGELLWTSTGAETMRRDVAIDARQTICCNTDKCFYIILDHDTATSTPKSKAKKFPRPIPKKAVFRSALWPHAMVCHTFDTLERITIGFYFQRLTLEFRHKASNEVFVYVLLTSSKASTIELLKEFQELGCAAKACGFNSSATSIEIDNDDPIVLDAVSAAIAPKALGVILHYQLVRQRWKHGDRGSVKRIIVLSDCGIYLMDEDYGGDGSSDCLSNGLGRPLNRFVDGAELSQVVEVQAAGDDPTAITIVLRLAALSKPHNWRLVCRTKEGAERLVEDVRKATRINGRPR